MPSTRRFGRARVALDLSKMSFEKALGIADEVGPDIFAYKVHASVLAAIKDRLEAIRIHADSGAALWVDLKFHDTPDTVADEAAVLKACGADMLTVHASGGPEMIRAAVENGPEMIIAVTQLTTLSNKQLEELFGVGRIEDSLKVMMEWAIEGGAHAMVCPPTRVGLVSTFAPEMKLIVPGTRMEGESSDDQKQVDTPFNAIRGGAYALVGGRKVAGATDPNGAVNAMAQEIERALRKN
jgi:orotidine-5'-phosphate decarboxylase